MKAMIFAAGMGTRLKPFTDTTPKALLPLAGKTLLEWQIEKLRQAGITDIVVNVHHFAEQIINYLQAHNNFGCRIAVSDERALLLDTGGGLLHAAPLLLSSTQDADEDTAPDADEPILVCNVDILSTIRLTDLRAAYDACCAAVYATENAPLGVLVVSERTTQRYLLFDRDNRLRGWTNIANGELRPASLKNQLLSTVRSPLNSQPCETRSTLTKYAFSGMQLLSPRIFPLLADIAAGRGGVFSMIDAYLALCTDYAFYAYVPTDYRMMDVGKTAQLAEAERFAVSMR